MLVLCNFLRKLMVSDKKIHRAFRTYTTLWTKPIREILNFHHLPKLYLGFKGQLYVILQDKHVKNYPLYKADWWIFSTFIQWNKNMQHFLIANIFFWKEWHQDHYIWLGNYDSITFSWITFISKFNLIFAGVKKFMPCGSLCIARGKAHWSVLFITRQTWVNFLTLRLCKWNKFLFLEIASESEQTKFDDLEHLFIFSHMKWGCISDLWMFFCFLCVCMS